MNYCNGVQSFINFTIFIPRNFSGGSIRFPSRRCKNKTFLHQDVVMMYFLRKGFMEDYLHWYAHKELFISNESMVGRMGVSTFSASNMHDVIDDNCNPYRNKVMDAMRMN